MKWKLPESGAIRIRYRFAWIPKRIGKYKIWLEPYWVRQVYYITTSKWHDLSFHLMSEKE